MQARTYLPPSFLVFMFLGPPAVEKCYHSFKLGIEENADGSVHGSVPGSINSKTGKKGGNSRSSSKEDIHAIRSGDVQSWKNDRSIDNEERALDIDEYRLSLEIEQFQATESSNNVSVSR